MKRIYLIAGLKVELTGEDSLLQVAKLPGFDIFEDDDRDNSNVDIHIHLDEDIAIANPVDIRNIHCFEVSNIKHSFSICRKGYLYEMYRQDGYKIVGIIHDPNSNKVFMSSCRCKMYLKYAIWVAFSLPAIREKVIPIHASSIVKKSEAVLFLGESGTGKSTHTGLWLQYIKDSYLLNDDSPLIRIKDDKIFVCGSPWSGKTYCYRQDIIPLKAIVRLSQYPENQINRTDKLHSIGTVHPSFPPFLAYDKSFSEKTLLVIDKIIEVIPVYKLKCRPDRQAVEVAYAAIY